MGWDSVKPDFQTLTLQIPNPHGWRDTAVSQKQKPRPCAADSRLGLACELVEGSIDIGCDLCLRCLRQADVALVEGMDN